jgi:hypothetical protein
MKRLRLYLIGFIVLILIVLLLGRYVRRTGVLDGVNSTLGQIRKASREGPASPAAKVEDKTSQPQKAASVPTAAVVPVRHIEDLMLHLSRPLMFEVSGVRGLAAGPEFYYIAASDPQAQQATLYRVRRNTFQMDGSRSLKVGSMFSLGGIHLGQQWLWVPLSQVAPTPASFILGLDPATLETKHTFAVDHEIAAVAQGMDGLIYGIDADAGSFYVWNLDGREIQRVVNSTGLKYTDLGIAGGQVLAVAVTTVETGGNSEVCGVIDVLDPVAFALQERHLSHARSVHGNQVTRAGFAFLDGEFSFLPDEGKMAMLLTYRLDGIDLQEFLR